MQIEKYQIAPSENLGLVLDWIKQDKTITFFSWKMFGLSNPNFDTKLADQYIDKEKKFLKILIVLNIKFNYIKLIPDELPKIFYNRKYNKEAQIFAKQVEKYFQEIYQRTRVINITDILSQNQSLRNIYDLVFRQSLKANIDSQKLKKEILFRQNKEIGLKAFGLFAAETAVIFKYFNNPVLLAGKRSIDTYKYEFFKYPKNRPVLPKLFVI